MTCVLTVVSLMKSSLPDLGVRQAAGDQARRPRARARSARRAPSAARGRGPRANCSITRLRDRRREQRVAASDDADRAEQLLGRVVLQHEAARAGAQRLVDVLVEVEGREYQDARRGRRRPGCGASPRARRARACGCPSARRSARSAPPCRPPRGRCSPPPPPRCPSSLASSMRKPARTIAWSSATRTRMLMAGRRRAAGASLRTKPPPFAVLGAHLAAVDLHALADADEAVAEAVARRSAEAVVAHLELQLARRA